MKKIAIFASGNGTNAKKIIDHFKNSDVIKVSLIVCNNPNAGVLTIANKSNIPVLMVGKNEFRANGYLEELNNYGTEFIVLAGFLWKLPASLIKAFEGKIINIHPALLPAYGGKGMYGNAVHEAVITAGERQSGITIHYVDEIYDNGEIIFQATCPVEENDTAESLAKKIHALEHLYYPVEIEKLLK
ncbi:MAG: phosphoribosylglycinamide formyltransferase [Ginsengibacter sp.]